MCTKYCVVFETVKQKQMIQRRTNDCTESKQKIADWTWFGNRMCVCVSNKWFFSKLSENFLCFFENNKHRKEKKKPRPNQITQSSLCHISTQTKCKHMKTNWKERKKKKTNFSIIKKGKRKNTLKNKKKNRCRQKPNRNTFIEFSVWKREKEKTKQRQTIFCCFCCCCFYCKTHQHRKSK